MQQVEHSECAETTESASLSPPARCAAEPQAQALECAAQCSDRLQVPDGAVLHVQAPQRQPAQWFQVDQAVMLLLPLVALSNAYQAEVLQVLEVCKRFQAAVEVWEVAERQALQLPQARDGAQSGDRLQALQPKGHQAGGQVGQEVKGGDGGHAAELEAG
jgi:hypothetical protein